jgi:hypothetical protein
MLNHHHLGEELKASRRVASSSPTLCHAKVVARCKSEQIHELLHHETIFLKSDTHDRDPPAPAKR